MEYQIKEVKRKSRDRDSQQISDLREEMLGKLTEKNTELRMLELEVQRLLNENHSLVQQNEDLNSELERLRISSMEHLDNMERELQFKYTQAQNSEEQIGLLQEEFLAFREEKKTKEDELKAKISQLKN